MAAARSSLEQSYPFYVDTHRWAAEAAVAANDHRAIAPLTGPILDRVAPRKEVATVATQVNIVLSPSQQHALESLNEADYELWPPAIIPPKRHER